MMQKHMEEEQVNTMRYQLSLIPCVFKDFQRSELDL